MTSPKEEREVIAVIIGLEQSVAADVSEII